MKRLVLEVVVVLAAFGIGMAAHRQPIVLKVPDNCVECDRHAVSAVITSLWTVNPCYSKPVDLDFEEARRQPPQIPDESDLLRQMAVDAGY